VWTGRDEDFGRSDDEDISHLYLERSPPRDGNWRVLSENVQAVTSDANVYLWLRNAKCADAGTPPPPPPIEHEPSPAPSDWSDASQETVMAEPREGFINTVPPMGPAVYDFIFDE